MCARKRARLAFTNSVLMGGFSLRSLPAHALKTNFYSYVKINLIQLKTAKALFGFRREKLKIFLPIYSLRDILIWNMNEFCQNNFFQLVYACVVEKTGGHQVCRIVSLVEWINFIFQVLIASILNLKIKSLFKNKQISFSCIHQIYL